MAETVIVSGTGTEVGKTWVSARLIEELRARGVPVAARKPVQSFDEGAGPSDAEILARASGEEAGLVCPPHRSYPLPLAPPMAAEALGKEPLALEDVASAVDLPEDGICLVEGVGGPRSPLADDGDTVDLAGSLGARRVILVAHPGLGTINEVTLCTEAFGARRVHVFLNRYDDGSELHARNLKWLVDTCGFEVTTTIEDLATQLTEGR